MSQELWRVILSINGCILRMAPLGPLWNRNPHLGISLIFWKKKLTEGGPSCNSDEKS
jgi:hypothetical protein